MFKFPQLLHKQPLYSWFVQIRVQSACQLHLAPSPLSLQAPTVQPPSSRSLRQDVPPSFGRTDSALAGPNSLVNPQETVSEVPSRSHRSPAPNPLWPPVALNRMRSPFLAHKPAMQAGDALAASPPSAAPVPRLCPRRGWRRGYLSSLWNLRPGGHLLGTPSAPAQRPPARSSSFSRWLRSPHRPPCLQKVGPSPSGSLPRSLFCIHCTCQIL